MSINLLNSEIAYKLNILRSVLDELKAELSKKRLERMKIHYRLFRIRDILDSLKVLAKKYNDDAQSHAIFQFFSLAQKAQAQKSTITLDDLLRLFTTQKLPVENIDNLSSYIDTLLTLFVYASEKLSDEYYREKLYSMVPRIESVIQDISLSIGADVGILTKIGNLISEIHTWGFGERWVTATAYLQALEIIINKLVSELNIEVHGNAGFKEKFRKVIEKLREEDVEIAKLEEKLPQVFWDLRHKIIHAGYEPNNEELDTIITWSIQILKKLRSLKTNSSS